jgi:hypothetical protein
MSVKEFRDNCKFCNLAFACCISILFLDTFLHWGQSENVDFFYVTKYYEIFYGLNVLKYQMVGILCMYICIYKIDF